MRLDKDVQQLINTHGYAVAFSRAQNGGAYDPSTGTVTGGSELTWSGRGVFVNYNADEVNGTTVTSDDRKLLLQAVDLDYPPEPEDIVDSEVKVITARTIKSGSTVVAYICQVRG